MHYSPRTFSLLRPSSPPRRYYCIDDLVEATEKQLAKLKEEHHPICRVPVITSLEEEHLIVSSSAKVGGPPPLPLPSPFLLWPLPTLSLIVCILGPGGILATPNKNIHYQLKSVCFLPAAGDKATL